MTVTDVTIELHFVFFAYVQIKKRKNKLKINSSYAFLVNGSINITKKTLKLYSFIYEVFNKKFNVIAIFSNNWLVIVPAKDCQFHTWTKHINIYYYFIC